MLLIKMFPTILLGMWQLIIWIYFGNTPGDPEGNVKDTKGKDIQNSYDFIVIGAGSAGAVVANRLTEIGDWNVLLLEAGGDESITGQIPLLAAALQLSPFDWQYKTTVQQSGACGAMTNKKCNWPRGKNLGGSSGINYMLYVRGNKYDYDEWAAMGNTGWSYNEVLPYFIKSEDNRNPYLANSSYHGTGGYLTVEETGWRTPLTAAFVQGGVEMGYPHRDCNGVSQLGFMFTQGTTRSGWRCSTNKAFLKPVRSRKNLHISMYSHVLKILIDPGTKKAYGVQFEKKGTIYNVNVTKEVILSAGAIGSPQILMLSGVGPAAHLQSMGINVLSNLSAVGQNMQDQVGLGGMIFRINETYSVLEDRYLNLPTLLNYTVYGGTPLSIKGGVEALAWVRTKYADSTKPDRPDMQLHFTGASEISDGGDYVSPGHGIRPEIFDSYFKPMLYTDTWSILPMALYPKSTGYLLLNSADPYDKPYIEPNYFTDPNGEDIKIQIEAVKIALALSKTEAFQKVGSQFYNATFPGCEAYKLWTDDYYGCWIKQYTLTLSHIIGTCRMGNSSDSNSAVDPTLKVKGIKGLRVIDASVMPAMPGGNTNAIAIMIGEKGADLIKSDWGRRK